jgi:hypothetical protein
MSRQTRSTRGCLAILVVGAIASCGGAGNHVATTPASSDAVLTALATHLAANPTMRTSDELRIQGTLLPQRSPATVTRDRELFEQLVTSGYLTNDSLSDQDRLHIALLCTSLLDTSESVGLRCLSKMAGAGASWARYLREIGIAAGGEPAESLAVGWACDSGGKAIATMAADYLARSASYEASIPALVKCVDRSDVDESIRVLLIRALGKIASPRARPAIDALLARSGLDDAMQAAAIWSFVELQGRHGRSRLDALKPIGEQAKSERAEGLAFLTGSDTSDAAPFGLETTNDLDSYERFADLDAPVCNWVRAHGGSDLIEGRRSLDATGRHDLLAALAAGGGFGFDMVKGSLFEGVGPADTDALLRIRRAVYTRDVVDPGRFDHSLAIVLKRARMEER